MPQETAQAVVSVDGDKLAEALRRITPFAAEKGRENLAAVYAESDGSCLQLTATDGFRMAHVTAQLPFPVGNFLMKVEGVKDFAFRHYTGGQVNIGCFVANTLQIGDVQVELLEIPYINYPGVVPENFDVEAIIETKTWIKAVRGSGAEKVGIVYNSAGCRMFSVDDQGNTLGCYLLPTQMCSGPEIKQVYKAEHFRRALTSCGATATIQVVDPKKLPEGKVAPTLFEADDYWHLLVPLKGWVREVVMTEEERKALKLLREVLDSIISGEVTGRLMLGGGKFYLEIGKHITMTEVIIQEPKLQEVAKEVKEDDPQ